MTRRIPLAPADRKLHLPCGAVVLIETADAPLLVGFNWYLSRRKDGAIAYVVGDGIVDGRKCRVTLSRHLMGAKRGQLVDHEHGDLLDYRRRHLRFCTHRQNMQNRRVSKNNRLGIKGVYFRDGRFRAFIQVDGRQLALGAFTCPKQAARAYDKAAAEHYGEFARLNFSPDRDWLFPHEAAGTWPPLTTTTGARESA